MFLGICHLAIGKMCKTYFHQNPLVNEFGYAYELFIEIIIYQSYSKLRKKKHIF